MSLETLVEPKVSSKSPSGSVILSVEGMTCASCAARIERKLRAVPGVQEAVVNFASQKAYVQTESEIPVEILESVVEKAGYLAKPYLPEQRTYRMYQAEQNRLGWRLILGGLLILPFLAEHLFMFWKPFQIPLWLQSLLAAPVFLFVGWPFHQAALRGLRYGEVTMDTLISLSSSVAFFASLPALVGISVDVYFDAGSLILFFCDPRKVSGDFFQAAGQPGAGTVDGPTTPCGPCD